MEYIDLTHKINNNLPSFPGDTKAQITSIMDLESHGVALEKFCCSTHSGTHIDAPGHFTSNKKKISDLDISSFFAKAYCVDTRNTKVIDLSFIENLDFSIKKAILFCTGFDEYFYQNKYFESYPTITKECAEFLVKNKATIVGVDCPSVDKQPYEIHKILLNNNIIIIENLTNLHKLINCNDIEVIALPLNIEAYGSPARVIAKIY